MTDPASPPALGICLEEYEYPYPVQFLPVTSDLQPLNMMNPERVTHLVLEDPLGLADYGTGIPPQSGSRPGLIRLPRPAVTHEMVG